MRPPRRSVAAMLGLGLLAGAGVAAVAAPAPAAAEDLSDTGAASMAQVAGCAAGSAHLLVSIVVDESGSLRETDPTNQRVNGINSAIDALADLRAGAGGGLEVEASLGSFAEAYTPLVSWLPLDAANSTQLKAASSAQLPARDAGRFTDYRAALVDARASLNARAAQLGGSSCKVILWFTDGAFDVAGDAASALTELCAPAGIVDQVRADRIAVIALALFHEPSSVTLAQREQLRAIAEGSGEGTTCGQTPVAAGTAGAYLRADDASALRRVFAGVGALINQGSQTTSVQCPSPACTDGVDRFPVDRGIGGIQLIVDSPTGAAELTLVGPDGQSIPLAPGAAPGGWGQLDVVERDGLTTAIARFDRPEGTQVGDWQVTALDSTGRPSPVAVDLYYFWGASLAVAAPDGALIGQDSPLTVTATVAGQAVSTDWYESWEVELAVDGAPLESRLGDDGVVASSLSLPDVAAPGQVVVTAKATAVTAPSGIRLAPVSVSAVLPTAFPPAFPTVEPTRLELPTLTSAAGAVGTLTLRGAERGPTTACLGGSDITGPTRAGALTLTAGSECVELGAGESVDWTFALRAESTADGQVSGDITVLLTGVDPGQTLTLSVPVSASMARPVAATLRWTLVAALVLLALLLPLALIAVGNRWVGRSRPAAADDEVLTPLDHDPAASEQDASTPGAVVPTPHGPSLAEGPTLPAAPVNGTAWVPQGEAVESTALSGWPFVTRSATPAEQATDAS